MKEELCYADATRLASLIRSKRVFLTEVDATFFAHIEEVNPKVIAVVTLMAQEAMRPLYRRVRRSGAAKLLGPYGVPFSIKDALDCAGPRRNGARSYLLTKSLNGTPQSFTECAKPEQFHC